MNETNIKAGSLVRITKPRREDDSLQEQGHPIRKVYKVNYALASTRTLYSLERPPNNRPSSGLYYEFELTLIDQHKKVTEWKNNIRTETETTKK